MGLERTRGRDGIAILSSMAQEDLSKVAFEQKPEEHVREPCCSLEKSTPGKRESKCKGPEVRVCLDVRRKAMGPRT